jgi:HEAT repeat protein
MNERITIWVERLKHPHPEIRKKAIEALEAIGEPDSLLPLAVCYTQDPDPEIRKLAQQAGKLIYYNQHRQADVTRGASEEERRRAAEILAKANAKKKRRR